MKYIFKILVIALAISSCSNPRLYYWGSNGETTKYEELTYQNYDEQTTESICELVCLYEDMIKHPGGQRHIVPPGIYAEYGYLLFLPSTAEAFEKHATKRQRKLFPNSDYSTYFPQKGEEMFKKEMELYPESKKFIEPLLNRLKGN